MLNAPLVFAALSAGLLGGRTLHRHVRRHRHHAHLLPAKKQHAIIPIIPARSSASAPWRTPALLHAGRISTYVLMGALAGAIGALGMRVHPFMPIHTLLYILGNLALIWLGLRCLLHPAFCATGSPGRAHHHAHPPVTAFFLLAQTQRFPFSGGMAWGCLPCGLVYGVLPFALLSGNAFSGAVLMLIFGLGALPHLLFAQAWRNGCITAACLRCCGGWVGLC